MVQVAGLDVAPGEKATTVVSVPVGNWTVEVPVVAINGVDDGPRVGITGGIHGAEYVGIEAVRRLAMELQPAQVAGSLVIVPVANTTAFFRRSIYTSGMDDNNLNREFPGDASGDASQALADWLFHTIIEPSQYYIDMHGGDMIEALVPFVLYLGSENREVEEAARQMAIASGLPRVMRSLTQGSTYAAATAAGIPAILSEIGGQGVWSEELVEQHVEGTRRVLRHLGVLEGDLAPVGTQLFYDTFSWVRSDVNGLFHPAVEVGETVQHGQRLGRVVDYFGRPLQTFSAPVAGEVVFLVTSLAMN